MSWNAQGNNWSQQQPSGNQGWQQAGQQAGGNAAWGQAQQQGGNNSWQQSGQASQQQGGQQWGAAAQQGNAWGQQQQQQQPAQPAAAAAAKTLTAQGCQHPTIGGIVRGSFSAFSENHSKPVFKKDTQVSGFDVMIYYWDERDGPSQAGWWFAPKVGGAQVWAYHPDTKTAGPPTEGWQVPYGGPVDATFIVQAPQQQAQPQQQQSWGNQQSWGGQPQGQAQQQQSWGNQQSQGQRWGNQQSQQAQPQAQQQQSWGNNQGKGQQAWGNQQSQVQQQQSWGNNQAQGQQAWGNQQSQQQAQQQQSWGNQAQGRKALIFAEDVKSVKTISDPATSIFQWEFVANDGTWRRLQPEDNDVLEAAFLESEGSPQDGGSIIQAEMRGTLYTIDFTNMTQTNSATGRIRSLRRRRSKSATNKISAADRNQQPKDDAEEEMLKLRQELEQEKSKRRSLEGELSQVKRSWIEERANLLKFEAEKEKTNLTIATMQQDLENWRQVLLPSTQLPSPKESRRPNLLAAAGQIIKLVPSSHVGIGLCKLATGVSVTDVHEIQNQTLWRKYCNQKQDIEASIRHRKDCPFVEEILPESCSKLLSYLKHISLSRNANEVLLLHGTKSKSVSNIIKEGFDDRLSEQTLYGKGIYFTTDFCKALQYTDLGDAHKTNACSGHLIVARVVLGHPYLAQGPMKTHKRPPMTKAHGVPHDSIIAQPGIPNNYPGGQVHHEIVVQDIQAYPELLIELKYDPAA